MLGSPGAAAGSGRPYPVGAAGHWLGGGKPLGSATGLLRLRATPKPAAATATIPATTRRPQLMPRFANDGAVEEDALGVGAVLAAV